MGQNSSNLVDDHICSEDPKIAFPCLLSTGPLFKPEMFHYVSLFQQLQITRGQFDKLVAYFRMYSDKALWDINIMKKNEFERFISIHAMPHQKKIFGRNSLFKLVVGESQDYLHFTQWLMIALLLDVCIPHNVRRPSGQLRISLIFRMYDKGGKGYLDYPDIQRLLLDLQSLTHPEDKAPTPNATAFLKLANNTPTVSILQFLYMVGEQHICGTSQILRFFCSFTQKLGQPIKRCFSDAPECKASVCNASSLDSAPKGLPPPNVPPHFPPEPSTPHRGSNIKNVLKDSQNDKGKRHAIATRIMPFHKKQLPPPEDVLLNPLHVPLLTRVLGGLQEDEISLLPDPDALGLCNKPEKIVPTKPIKPAPKGGVLGLINMFLPKKAPEPSKPAEEPPAKPKQPKTQNVEPESYVFGVKPGTKLYVPEEDGLVELRMGPMRIPTRNTPRAHEPMFPPIREDSELRRSSSATSEPKSKVVATRPKVPPKHPPKKAALPPPPTPDSATDLKKVEPTAPKKAALLPPPQQDGVSELKKVELSAGGSNQIRKNVRHPTSAKNAIMLPPPNVIMIGGGKEFKSLDNLKGYVEGGGKVEEGILKSIKEDQELRERVKAPAAKKASQGVRVPNASTVTKDGLNGQKLHKPIDNKMSKVPQPALPNKKPVSKELAKKPNQ